MKQAYLVSVGAANPVEEAARSNHYEGEVVAESFWRKAAASLPPHARRRYAHLFEAAERWEPVIEFIAHACSSARRGLVGLSHASRSHPHERRQKHAGLQERSAF